MKLEELTNLTDEDLLREKKKIKSNNIINAFLIGIFIGIAIYSTVNKGLGFFTFFPLIFAYLLIKNGKNNKAISTELKSRGLI